MQTKQSKPKKNVILRCENIRKSYDDFLVLDGIDFSLRRGERIGIVGPNGIGKSTLLKITAGIDKDYEGKVHAKKGVKYIPQEISGDELNMSVLKFLQKENGGGVQNVASSFFQKLNLSIDIFDKKISELSGGEKNKVAITRILISPHDTLLLDEPTNNLDFETLWFLERVIKKSKKTFLIISHDRKFLDNFVSKILEIGEFSKKATMYDGTFSQYMSERKARVEKEWSDYNETIKKNAKIKSAADKHLKSVAVIDKTLKDKRKMSRKITDKDHLASGMIGERAGKIGRQAKVLKNRLEKMTIDTQEKPKQRLPIKLDLVVTEKSGDRVLNIEKVEKQIGNTKIGPLDLSVVYGDRILIVGANGTGKSTLIKMILGESKIDKGNLKVGKRVKFGYLPQETNFETNETLRKKFLATTDKEEGEMRKILNRFGLTEEDMKKKITDLSPGERSRFILATLVAQTANCLVLDEPSNHLDLEALGALEQALEKYKGTLIVVSHDRHFIDNINVAKTYLLKDGALNSIFDYKYI